MKKNTSLFSAILSACNNRTLYYLLAIFGFCETNMYGQANQMPICQGVVCTDCIGADPCTDISCTNDFDDCIVGNGTYCTGFLINFEGDVNENSVDVFDCSGENVISFVGQHNEPNNVYHEGFVINLSQPILPGCQGIINFHGVASTASQFINLNHSIRIIGSEAPPCVANYTNNTGYTSLECDQDVFCPATGVTFSPLCLGSTGTPLDLPLPTVPNGVGSCAPASSMQPIVGTFTNNSNTPINFLVFVNANQFSHSARIMMDHLTVTTQCPITADFTAYMDCNDLIIEPSSNANAVSELWNFGDGTTSTDENPEHTYTTPGTYTITHIVIGDCGQTVTSNQQVEYYPLSEVLTNTTAVIRSCINDENGLVTFSLCLVGEFEPQAITFQIQGLPSGISINPNSSFAANGIATAVFSNVNPCVILNLSLTIGSFVDGTVVPFTLNVLGGTCTKFDEQLVLEDCLPFTCACPSGPNNYNIGNYGQTTLLSQSGLPIIGVSNACIAIHGTLVIDVPYYNIMLSELRMHTASEIRVQGFSNLLLDRSHVLGCDSLWRGIVTLPDSWLTCRYDTIMDAQYAIRLSDKSRLEVNDNHFYRNHIGVFNAPVSQTAFLDLIGFRGNRFHNENGWAGFANTLLPRYFGITTFGGTNPSIPLPGTTTLSGLELHNFVANVAFPNTNNTTSTQPTNFFYDISFGVRSSNSSYDINSAQFWNIANRGIWATGEGHTVNQRGLGFGLLNSFSNVGNMATQGSSHAIDFTGINGTITDNTMANVLRGVIITGASNCNVNVVLNQINARRFGVKVVSSDDATSVIVRDNVIIAGVSNETSNRGIWVTGNNTSVVNTISIIDNQITMTGANNGIEVQDTRFVHVISNDVTMPNTGATGNIGASTGRSGILINNSNNATVRCNGIGQFSNSAANHYGLRVISSIDGLYEGNTFAHTLRGAYFGGSGTSAFTNSGTILRANSFFNHGAGLHVVGSIGTQGPGNANYGNIWTGTYSSGFGAMHSSQQIAIVNPIFFNSAFGAQFSTTTNVSGWFSPTANPPALVPEDCLEDENLTDGGSIGNAEMAIVTGDYNYGIFDEQIEWAARKYFYAKLAENPELIDAAALIEAFWQDASEGTIGKLYGIDADKSNLYAMSDALKALLANIREDIATAKADILATEAALGAAPSEAELAALHSEKQAVYEGYIKPLEQEYQVLLQAEKEVRIAAADAIQTENSTISTSELYESNEKTVNVIYLATVAQGQYSFSEAQTAALYSIAHQCPLAGGPAVTWARSLYVLVDDMMAYDDEPVCQAAGYAMLAQQQGSSAQAERMNGVKNTDASLTSQVAELQIWPNPSADWVQISYALPYGKVVILNSLGQQVGSYMLSVLDSNTEIDVRSLNTGIYLCQIVDINGIVVETKSFMIAK